MPEPDPDFPDVERGLLFGPSRTTNVSGEKLCTGALKEKKSTRSLRSKKAPEFDAEPELADLSMADSSLILGTGHSEDPFVI